MNHLSELRKRGKYEISNRHMENVVSFMITVASYFRDDWKYVRSNSLLGSEKNPGAAVVLLAMADNLDNAPSWSVGTRNTVMCYLEVVEDHRNEGVPTALLYAVNLCEFPQTRRLSAADHVKQKLQIVNYCGNSPPFRETE